MRSRAVAATTAMAMLMAGCATAAPGAIASAPVADVTCADTAPPPEVRARACKPDAPCAYDYGLWMPRDVALDYACNTSCCRDSQKKLREFKCESNLKVAAAMLGVGVLLGFVGGVYVTVRLQK